MESEFPDIIKGAMETLMIQFGKPVHKILTQFLPLDTDSLFGQSVWYFYLPLGSIRTMFLMIYQNSSSGRCLLSSLGIKEFKAPGFLEPAAASVSKRAFCLLSALDTEIFVALKYSMVLLCFILDKVYRGGGDP